MEQCIELFSYVKSMMNNEMDIVLFEDFLSETRKKLRNEVTEFWNKEELYKIAILLNLLKKRAERYDIEHQLESLFAVVETSALVTQGERYEDEFFSSLLVRLDKSDEETLKKLFDEKF